MRDKIAVSDVSFDGKNNDLYDDMGRVRNDMEGCQHAVRLDLWAGLQETKEGKEAHPEWSRSSL